MLAQPLVKDTVVCYQLKSLEDCANIFAGKSAFTDTLLIPCKETDLKTTYTSDVIREWEFEADPKTFSFDSLKVVPDYNTTVLKNEYVPDIAVTFYPVYLVNSTGTIRAFAGKDSYTFAIQEAMDKKGNWWPIEARVYDFCGNGTWLLKIRPGEFATILFHKYTGSFKTKLRVRIK
ncbi:hypothetical protein [Taibaiella koreensis]|uniref:hypothetical protein n=1 Tax=Taibaiella koreensis TaxID=1268548 RepID=UPI000E59A5DD|nr:hypothetical protein [Taibaiella koreensis]